MDNKFLALIIGFGILIAFVGVIGVTSDDPELTTAKPEKTTVEVVETTLPPADMTTEPTTEAKKEFRNGDLSYLDDALFIGDSRTVGLQSYTDIKNADFFCSVSLSVFKVFTEKTKVDGNLTDLRTLLKSKNYAKVYVMLGINELGYNRQTAFGKYKELINEIRTLQPDAYIFIEGNIHVGAERSARDTVINNKAVNEYNALLESLQNEKDIFYIDVNSVFDDANGNLSTSYSSDGIHLFPKDYKLWRDFILTKTIRVDAETVTEPQLTTEDTTISE